MSKHVKNTIIQWGHAELEHWPYNQLKMHMEALRYEQFDCMSIE